MPKLKAAEVEFLVTSEEDLRVGHLLERELSDKMLPSVVLVGFPCDEGVRRNGGRVGAAQGPDRIRHHLYRMTPDAEQGGRFSSLLGRTRDIGNLELSGDLEQDQQNLAAIVSSCLNNRIFPIILGGGHETAFGHFLGYVEAGIPVSILNWDAHPDVRELVDGKGHSGSPFRQALTHASGACVTYQVTGLLAHSTAESHLRFLSERGGRAYRGHGLNSELVELIYRELEGKTMVSFDLDAVDQAWAPGVSAPATGGMSAELWLQAAFLAGQSAEISSFDLVELNPQFDRDDQTARLAALTVWNLLKGLCSRRVIATS